MKGKRGLAGIIIALIIAGVVAGGAAVYTIYLHEPDTPGSSGPSAPSTPSRCYYVAQNDTYVKPDFDRLKQVMQNQPIVLDVPEKGKISLRFFHFTDGCRIWDKSYILSNGQITENSENGDIQVWIHSSYVDSVDESNFCDMVKEARNNGDLAQWSEIGEATLLWRYKSMLKYRECLGLKIT